MTLAKSIFDGDAARGQAESVLEARLGEDAFSGVSFDWYDGSIELHGVADGVSLSFDDRAWLAAQGFSRVWVNYRETQRYIALFPKIVDCGVRDHHEHEKVLADRMARRRIKAVDLRRERDALRAECDRLREGVERYRSALKRVTILAMNEWGASNSRIRETVGDSHG